MPDRRDQGDAAGGGGAHNLFLIEGPEILQRAATTRDDQQVGTRQRPVRRHRIKPLDGPCHLRGGALALDQCSPDEDPDPEPIRETMKYVADHRAGWARHDADDHRHVRYRLFAFAVEQPFGGKPAAALLELPQHRTFTGHFHRLHDDLVLRTPAIDCQLAGDDDLKPFFRLHGERAGNGFPADTVEGIAVVLQGKIEMPRRGPGGTGNLGPYPHEIELAFHSRLQALCKLGNGEEGWRVRACLGIRQGGYIWVHAAGPLSWQLNLMPYCAPGKPQRPAPERRTIR